MTLLESVRAVADADGRGAIDWDAVATAAKSATPPGDVSLSSADRDQYAADVRAARDGVADVVGFDVDVPATVEVQNRRHWIDANLPTFRRILAPLADASAGGVARTVNTASLAGTLAFVARRVLGQYDPALLSDGDHALYVVHPNVQRGAADLDVDPDRFRRWILFHEVTHAAEFGAAPWLSDYLGERVTDATEAVAAGEPTDAPMGELTRTMTVVEGYAEFVMDRAFDGDVAEMRAKLDARRRGGDPATRLLRRLLGLGMKREQYERGREFFDAVVAAHDVSVATRVWESPSTLPSEAELDRPLLWVDRVV